MFLNRWDIEKRSINARILPWVIELIAVVCYDYSFEEYLQMLAFLWDMVLDYERDYAKKYSIRIDKAFERWSYWFIDSIVGKTKSCQTIWIINGLIISKTTLYKHSNVDHRNSLGT